MTADRGDMWVFGYGSLMWKPGFPFEERHPATLHGFHRSLCVYSHVHRGTPDRPGLVLGLDRGGSCRGVAFRVEEAHAADTLAYLRGRELVTSVYQEATLAVRLDDGRRLDAVAYVVDRSHAQYARRLPRHELLRFVLQGEGVSGRNPDYVRATHAHLVELGIKDPTLDWLALNLPATAQAQVV